MSPAYLLHNLSLRGMASHEPFHTCRPECCTNPSNCSNATVMYEWATWVQNSCKRGRESLEQLESEEGEEERGEGALTKYGSDVCNMFRHSLNLSFSWRGGRIAHITLHVLQYCTCNWNTVTYCKQFTVPFLTLGYITSHVCDRPHNVQGMQMLQCSQFPLHEKVTLQFLTHCKGYIFITHLCCSGTFHWDKESIYPGSFPKD